MLFSQRIIIGTANLLWWTTTVYLSMFWLQQFQFQQSYATSDEPWTPNQTLLKMYWIEIIQWHCSGWICLLTLPYVTQKREHATWNDHIVWQYLNQVDRLLIIWRDCVYIKTYIVTHIKWSQENCQISHVHGSTECWIPTTVKSSDFTFVKSLGTWKQLLLGNITVSQYLQG